MEDITLDIIITLFVVAFILEIILIIKETNIADKL